MAQLVCWTLLSAGPIQTTPYCKWLYERLALYPSVFDAFLHLVHCSWHPAYPVPFKRYSCLLYLNCNYIFLYLLEEQWVTEPNKMKMWNGKYTVGQFDQFVIYNPNNANWNNVFWLCASLKSSDFLLLVMYDREIINNLLGPMTSSLLFLNSIKSFSNFITFCDFHVSWCNHPQILSIPMVNQLNFILATGLYSKFSSCLQIWSKMAPKIVSQIISQKSVDAEAKIQFLVCCEE